VREIRTLRLTRRGLETWPRWKCEPNPQSKERDWKPSTYSRRACPRPYLRGLGYGNIPWLPGASGRGSGLALL
jgi:hypothetical protein